jgi:hypothetical protein
MNSALNYARGSQYKQLHKEKATTRGNKEEDISSVIGIGDWE